MILIKAIIDFLIVILLVRLLIRPIELNFNQIYSLIYKITDPILKPAKAVVHKDFKAVLISVLALVVIRGLIYITMKPISVISGVGISFLDLLQLLFRFYMVVWFIAILTGDRAQTSVISLLQRAFLPLSKLASRLSLPKQSFSFFSFMILLLIYSALTFVLHFLITYGSIAPSFSFFHSMAEGLILIISLFPGFFSMVIIVGALLSWVSPDPYNPVVQTIYGITEPLLAPFRKLIPNLGGLDVSPIVALLCFQIIGGLLQKMIADLMRLI